MYPFDSMFSMKAVHVQLFSCLQLALYNLIVVSNELWSTESEKHLLPTKLCPDHMLVVNDVLQQRNGEKIEITITLHGNTKRIK